MARSGFIVSTFAILLSVLAQIYAATEKLPISVNYNSATGKYSVSKSYDGTADAFGYFYPNLAESGWNYLDASMQTNNINSADEYVQKSRSLGYLEGYATCNEIYTFYPNFYSAVFGTSTVGQGTLTFLQENYDWLEKTAKENAGTDDYWLTVQGILAQVNGLLEGFSAGCNKVPGEAFTPASLKGSLTKTNKYATLDQPTLLHFLLINAWGDLYQITMKYREVGNPIRLINARKNRKSYVDQMKVFDRCSAIIKLLDNNQDIVFGHATWDTYESLGPRILKHIQRPTISQGKFTASPPSQIWFSSSPGILSSVDDFFVIHGKANLGVIETTNELYNLRLLDKVVPSTVLSWTRAVTSHIVAANGWDWGQQFSRYASGTYTNQWMALDLDLFKPGQPLPKGFFTVFEEVPGLTHVEDKTETLESQRYWGSYNVPYYSDISEASGYAKLCSLDVNQCHDTAPRGLIFQQYQSQITNVDGGKWMLAYNSFQNDTASQNDPCNAIACRGDLYAIKAEQGGFGALDVKVTSVQTAKLANPQIHARLGPTHDQQPYFCWSQINDEGYVHQGQPDCFNYDFTVFPPNF